MSSEQNVFFHPSKTEFSRNKKFDPDYFFGKTRLLRAHYGRKFCALINLFVQRGTAVSESVLRCARRRTPGHASVRMLIATKET